MIFSELHFTDYEVGFESLSLAESDITLVEEKAHTLSVLASLSPNHEEDLELQVQSAIANLCALQMFQLIQLRDRGLEM